MKNVIAAIALLIPTLAMGEEPHKDIHIIFDFSAENQIIVNPQYNQSIKIEINRMLREIDVGLLDTISLHASGRPSGLGELRERFNKRFPLSFNGYQPNDITAYVSSRVSELSSVMTSGSTDVLWAVQEIAEGFDCSNLETHVIVLSNGIISGNFSGGDYTFYPIQGQPFSDCHSITYVGFGAAQLGTDGSLYRAVRSLFLDTSKQAGFKHVYFYRK